MDAFQFKEYLIELLADGEHTPAELADKIIETLECHPEVVEIGVGRCK